jgi:hypothetical protein
MELEFLQINLDGRSRTFGHFYPRALEFFRGQGKSENNLILVPSGLYQKSNNGRQRKFIPPHPALSRQGRGET